MPHPDLLRYRDGFFEKFLAELPGSPTRESLQQQQPAGMPFMLMGDYVEHAGTAVPAAPAAPNATITPKYAIRTEVSGAVQTFVLVWIVERIDVATDSKATVARILADFRKPSVTDETKELSTELAEKWAKALATEAVKTALAKNLAEITQVPDGLPMTNLDELKSFLLHFGTYKPNGEYYTKRTVAEGKFPEGVSAAYLAAETGNVAEVQLQRDHFYCSALVSERLWNPQAEAGNYRQLVYQMDDQGETTTSRWRLVLLHTVAVKRPAGDVFNRFVFFHAPVGVGLEIKESARTAVAPETAAFAERLSAHMADLAGALSDPNVPIVGKETDPFVLLLGAVTEDFPRTLLPEGVIEAGEGPIRTFRCPPQHLKTLWSRPDIQDLTISAPVKLLMKEAKKEIDLTGRGFPAGVTAANTGKGVVIGIVDSGIDGSHPAFLGRSDDATKSRIHSVWNIWEKGGQSPFKRSGEKADYRIMKHGKEYIGHDEVITVRDPDLSSPAHGTHVAGIAAGRPFDGTWPGGIAPAATIVVASVGPGGLLTDILSGVAYCFQKATELKLPCVVNISMGTSMHSYDSMDPFSIALTQLVTQDKLPPVNKITLDQQPQYVNGRVVCVAAGNERGDNLHWQATIPANSEVSVLYRPAHNPAIGPQFFGDGVMFWVYNEDGSTVRLRISARDSANALLKTQEVGLQATGGPVNKSFPSGLQVDIHNGPERPYNRHYNPQIYWYQTPPTVMTFNPWVIRIRNMSGSPCVIHGYAPRNGRFMFSEANTKPLIGVTYSTADLKRFESHKISSPGTAAGVICVAAFTSRLGGAGSVVGGLAPFSSPGPLRAAGPGRRAIDVAAPGDPILSAWGSTINPNTGTVTVRPKDTQDMSGTSMATPVVTGLVAARLQMDPTLNTGQVVRQLELACKRQNPEDSVNDWGLGRIDAAVFLKP